VRIQLKEGKSRKEDLGKSAGEGEGARYVRYNPNIDASRSDDFSLAALYRHLKSKHGFEKVEPPVFPVPDKVFFMDEHLEDLLVFPSSTSWWTGDLWYESGAVILQDKASCFPAKVLMEGWEESEGDCLDATYVSILREVRGTIQDSRKDAWPSGMFECDTSTSGFPRFETE
jgi:putative methyltransferase